MLATACGGSGTPQTASIGAGLRGPSDLTATVYARGLTHVSALTFDARGRLWATTSGSATHATDGVYLIASAGARPVKVVSGLVAPLGLVWVDGQLIVSSLGRVTAYSGFDGSHFRRQNVIIRGPVAGGENNNVVLAPNGRLVMGISASCDHCVPASKWSGAIVSFRPDGSGLQLVARNVRAAYGLAYLPGTSTLLATMNQRDDLGARTPGDWLAVVRAGQNWGFPTATASRRRPAPHGRSRQRCSTPMLPPAASRSSRGSSVSATGARRSSPNGSSASSSASPLQAASGTYTGAASTLLTGFKNPLPVLASGSAMLVGDWGTGVVYRIAAARAVAPPRSGHPAR